MKKILDIPVLTRGGAKQLDTDIGIFILIFFILIFFTIFIFNIFYFLFSF